jgi:hypothetical protein
MKAYGKEGKVLTNERMKKDCKEVRFSRRRKRIDKKVFMRLKEDMKIDFEEE